VAHERIANSGGPGFRLSNRSVCNADPRGSDALGSAGIEQDRSQFEVRINDGHIERWFHRRDIIHLALCFREFSRH
jgi:hypothetical protein